MYCSLARHCITEVLLAADLFPLDLLNFSVFVHLISMFSAGIGRGLALIRSMGHMQAIFLGYRR